MRTLHSAERDENALTRKTFGLGQNVGPKISWTEFHVIPFATGG